MPLVHGITTRGYHWDGGDDSGVEVAHDGGTLASSKNERRKKKKRKEEKDDRM